MARTSRLVTGKFVTYTVDGPDADDLPDEVPVVGLVVQLTPSIDRVPELSVPQTAFLRAYVGTTNSAGVLVSGDGTTGLRVPVTSPENFTYKVVIVPPDGSPQSPYEFSVLIPAASGNFDLTAAIPVSPTPEQDFTQWLAVVSQVTALRDQAIEAVNSVPGRVADALASDEVLALAAAAAVQNALENEPIVTTGAGVTRPDDELVIGDVNGAPSWMRARKDGLPSSAAVEAISVVLGWYRGPTRPDFFPPGVSFEWHKTDIATGELLDIRNEVGP